MDNPSQRQPSITISNGLTKRRITKRSYAVRMTWQGLTTNRKVKCRSIVENVSTAYSITIAISELRKSSVPIARCHIVSDGDENVFGATLFVRAIAMSHR